MELKLMQVHSIANHYASLLHRLATTSTTTLLLLRSVHCNIIGSGFIPRAHILNRLIHLYTRFHDLPSALHLFNSSPNPSDIVVRTTLLTAFAASDNVSGARKLFDETSVKARDVVFYNAMISAYSRTSNSLPGVQIFQRMLSECHIRPDNFSFTSVISAASGVHGIRMQECGCLHGAVIKFGMVHVVSVTNALIALYFKCVESETTSYVRKVFDEMIERCELTWTTMVVGYVRKGDIEGARGIFDEMNGRFDVVWNAMISGYVQTGIFDEAFVLFRKMCSLNIPLDEFTYTSTLSACINSGNFINGKSVHAHIIRSGSDFEPESALPVENVLVTLYSKYGNVDTAQRIFNKIRRKDSVSWNSMLSGYLDSNRFDDALAIFNKMPRKNQMAFMVMVAGFVHNNLPEDALKLFNRMREEYLQPCDYTYAGAISACSMLGAFEHGRQLHAQLVRIGFESSNSASNALLTMYSKCGSVEDAHLVFLSMPNVDHVSWNSMIAALGQHGHGMDAVRLFDYMIKEGIQLDRISFLTMLSACSHAGLIDEGLQYFELMKNVYHITPGEDHYARLIDLLGRAGRMDEAMNIIQSMPFEPGPSIWESVLSGCRLHNNMDLAVHAADKLFDMIPKNDGTYILLCNTYSAAGRHGDAARVRNMMRDRGVKKEPGCSWIEIESKVHVFLVNDVRHPEVKIVHEFLEMVMAKMRKLGYVPDTKFVLQDMELEDKEYALFGHSEKLAVSYGLLKLGKGMPIRVLKNLRICGDCHSAIMFMSKAVEREIVVRDGKRFHHFKDGECSCGNYW